MADYQAFNYGTPDQLAERSAAWDGFGGIGSSMSPALVNFINNKVYPSQAGPKPPENLGGDDLLNWGRSNGYNVDNSDTPWNPDTWSYANTGGISSYLSQMGAGAYTSPDGRFGVKQLGGGAFQLDDLSRGPGEKSYAWYGPDGAFNRDFTGAKNMTNWQGILSVAGAALGFGALGAAGAAGGVAGGAAAGGAEAGVGAGVTGFGDAGLMYGGADAASAASLGGGASIGGGAAFGDGLTLGGASGADMDAFYGGSSLGGGPAAAMNPSMFGQAMSLMSSGGFTPEFASQSLFGTGGGGGMFGGGGGSFGSGSAFGPGSALRYGSALSQIYSGLEGRKKAKQIAAQMQAAAPTAAPPMRPLTTPYGMDLPSPGDITSAPGYQAGLEAVRRSMASQGYQGSGNMMMAMGKYGGDFYNQFVNQRIAANNQTLQAASTANDEDLRAWATLNDQRLKAAQAQAGPAYASMSSNALLTNGFGGLVRAFL